jgi:hypothetical protein
MWYEEKERRIGRVVERIGTLSSLSRKQGFEKLQRITGRHK